MGSASSPTTRARQHLSASLLFSPRELKQYRRWQSLCTTLHSAEQGCLPTAIQYDEFQQWLRRQDSGYFSDVFEDIIDHIKTDPSQSSPLLHEVPRASLCRHAIHPITAGQSRSRCPVCTIDIHLNYMKALTRTLHQATGRPLPGTGTPSEQQEGLYCAWLRGKIDTLRQVTQLEDMAEQETEWLQQQNGVRDSDTKTASEALDLYWFETSGLPVVEQRSSVEKSVTFADDTNFSSGRHADFFLKRSPRYEPGKYTVPEENKDDDKEHGDVSEDSEDYNRTPGFRNHEVPLKHGCDKATLASLDRSRDSCDLHMSNTCSLQGNAIKRHPMEHKQYASNRTLSSVEATSSKEADVELSYLEVIGDWEDIDSPSESESESESDSDDDDDDDDDAESTDGSFVCFQLQEDASYIMFSDD